MQTATSAVPVSACSEHRANGGVLTQGEEKSKLLRRAPRHQSSPFRVLLSVLSVLFLAPLTSYAQAKYPFDLPAQPLAESLRAVGHQTSTNVMFEPRLVKGLDAPALRTETTPTEAIRLLLAGTELTALQTAASTVLIQRTSTSEKSAPTSQAVAPTGTNGYTRLAQAETNPSAQDVRSESSNSERDNSSRSSAEAEKNRIVLEEIVVVGTNIRGVYPSSSPVEIYTAEDIARTGATTTEQFIGKLPQNLGTRNEFGTGVTPGFRNGESVTGIDLRGLGVGTTLVLMNGRRLPLASVGQSADVSLIPLSAIERVELLTDGASAIYGSDAVGGVVNFVLRDDFEGAETGLRYGGVTDGNLRQKAFNQTFGHSWRSGRALVSYDYLAASALNAADRSFTTAVAPGTLTPRDRRQSALASLSQDFGERLSLAGDFAFSRRAVSSQSTDRVNANPNNQNTFSFSSETDQYFATLDAGFDITGSVHGSVSASYGKLDVDSSTSQFNIGLGTTTLLPRSTRHSVLDLTTKLDGALVELPAGAVRFSVGGGYLEERFEAAVTLSGATSNRDLGRTSSYAFGELMVPLIGRDRGMPLAHRLELTLATRYTRYKDSSEPRLGREFGDKTIPKVGVLWAPSESVSLRGTYGSSFRAPSLTEIDPTSAIHNLLVFPVLGVPTTLLALAGPSAQLEPETADSYTIGIDLRPRAQPGFNVSVTYFNFDYQDRIAVGPTTPALANPAAWPDVIFQTSSAAVIERFLRETRTNVNQTAISLADPAAAALALAAIPGFTVLDTRARNLALSKLDGLDIGIHNRFEPAWGRLNAGVQATRIFDYREQTTPSAPINTAVDTVSRPVGLRGRAYVDLVRGHYQGTVGVNYVDDYANPFSVNSAAIRVKSWTTIDLSLAYDFDARTHRILGGTRINVSVQNLFDEAPPFVGRGAGGPLSTLVGFDPANANPLGRIAYVGITKQW